MCPTCWPFFFPSVVMATPLGMDPRPAPCGTAGPQRSLQCLDAANDLGDLLGDLRLAGAVVLAGQGLDHLASVLGGGLHGDTAADLFADGRVQEALEQPHLE